MGSATEQEYRLKWNNHRSTILSVVDSLLEEESLVDVILSAESKFIKAHRVILSACSPYFRDLFRSRDLQDKAPVIVLKDVDFENLKSLVEYMYRGEANVSQSMLQSFIATAESLKIRGLADGNPSNNNNNSNGANTPTKAGKTFDGTNDLASKSFTTGPVPTSSPFGSSLLASTPNALNPSAPGTPSRFSNNKRKRSPQMNATNGGGILAARLAKMSQGLAADGSVIHPPPPATGPLFDGLNPAEMMLGGRPIPPALLAAAQAQLGNGPQLTAHHLAGLLPQQQPTVKKSRKSEKPKANKQLKPQQHFQQQPQQQQTAGSNNNIDDDEGVLRIDDDDDDQEMTSDKTEKENRQGLPPGLIPKIKIGGVSSMKNLSGQNVHSNDDKSDGADQENGNGDSEEEEQQVEGPAENVLQRAAASGLINPWTGEPFVNEDQEENSMTGDTSIFPPLQRLPMLAAGGMLTGPGGVECNVSIDGSGSPLNSANNSTIGEGGTPGAEGKDGKPKYACERCGRAYQHQATLVRHLRYECGISASYPCSLCGRKFKRRDVLKGHVEKCANKSAAAAMAAVQQQTQPGQQTPGGGGLQMSPVLPPPPTSIAPPPPGSNQAAFAAQLAAVSGAAAAALAASQQQQQPFVPQPSSRSSSPPTVIGGSTLGGGGGGEDGAESGGAPSSPITVQFPPGISSS